jgi:hypothetical protein
VKDTAESGWAVSRCTQTRRIEFNKLRATSERPGAGRLRDLLVVHPTTKLRKTDSRYLFLATAGQQKPRREDAGLDQIGSPRHG